MYITLTGLGRRNARGEGQIGKLSQDINIHLIRHVGDAMHGLEESMIHPVLAPVFTRNECPSVADYIPITFFPGSH
jgi:hypothetical protein